MGRNAEMTIVDIVAEKDRKAIENDTRALEAARCIVAEGTGRPWTRVSFTNLIIENTRVNREVAVWALDELMFCGNPAQRILHERDGSWELVPIEDFERC